MEASQSFNVIAPHHERVRSPAAGVHGLLQLVYAAALGDVTWAAPLAGLAVLVDADVTALVQSRVGHRWSCVIESHGERAAMLAVALGDASAPPPHHLVGLPLDGGGAPGLRLCAVRHWTRGRFAESHLQCIDEFGPHLAVATRVAHTLRHATRTAEALRTMEAERQRPIALVDAQARVLHASSPFEHACTRGEALRLDGGVVSAMSPATQAAIAGALARACLGLEGGIIDLPGTGGMRPGAITVSAARLCGSSPFDQEGWAWLTLTEPTGAHEPDVLGLQRAYGLTRAEARLVRRLVEGATVREAAVQLQVSIHTARTHLKHAMSKMGVCRQHDVIRLVLTGSAGDRSPHA